MIDIPFCSYGLMGKPLLIVMLLGLGSCSRTESSRQSEDRRVAYQTTGSVERLDPAIDLLIPKDAEIEILASGFDWSEGPLWLADQEALIFTDVPANRIWRWSEKDSLSIYLEPSGYLGNETGKKEPGANGLALDKEGRLVLCQHGERQIARLISSVDDPKPEFEPISTSYQGKRFNSPNDLVISSSGEIYFTDPPYGLDDWDPKELDFQGVYKIDKKGELVLLLDSLTRPNGIGLSPDEQILYIAQSDPGRARYFAYELDGEGNVVSGKLLLDVTDKVGGERKGLPDGLKIDGNGNLFATGPGGVLVINPEGKLLGTVMTGVGTANCAFDADEKYLYMTADMHLMRIRLK